MAEKQQTEGEPQDIPPLVNAGDGHDQLTQLADAVDKLIVDPSSQKNSAKTKTEEADDAAPPVEVDVKSLTDAQLVQYLQLKDLQKRKERWERSQQKGKDVEKEHKFWNTQPVVGLKEEIIEENGPIDASTTLADIKTDPYNMPTGFEWYSIDITDPAQAQEVYTLLNENYVEDDECVFRFDYSIAFLQWALTPPGYLQDWHVGVRNSKTGKIMGCITAIPVDVRVYDKTVPMAEINFLCVHKKLRTKRLAPVLIKEITRRVNLQDRWQAVYTAGVVLPKPVSRCRYYHRSLNPKKLIEAKFSSLPPRTTMASHLKKLKLPKQPAHRLRQMIAEDVPAVHGLLTDYLNKKTQLAQVFTHEDVGHILLPRTGVVSTYVLEEEGGKITDLCSFYYLPSTIMKNPLHNKLNAVYSYYNIATSMPLDDLVQDALILARNESADVFNALDLMENGPTFEKLQFGAGDGWLQYYVYNWKCPVMPSDKVGIVLL